MVIFLKLILIVQLFSRPEITVACTYQFQIYVGYFLDLLHLSPCHFFPYPFGWLNDSTNLHHFDHHHLVKNNYDKYDFLVHMWLKVLS